MFNSIEEYLDTLKNEMKDADPALIQDAQSDAREHLSAALAVSRAKDPGAEERDLLAKIVEAYGAPEETASAYREVERRTSPVLNPTVASRSWVERFLGVYTDPRAWGALLYMLIAFVTGVFYFTWAVTGVSLSISLLLFIFGFPVALLFLLSVRGLVLLEGRLVEALLGVRMPRRPLFSHQDMKWFERLKALLTDRGTWAMMIYMLIQFVAGTLYFVVLVTVLSISLASISLPFVQLFSETPVFNWIDGPVDLPYWGLALSSIGGFLLWTSFMHLSRGIGQLHGKFAKWLLVTE